MDQTAVISAALKISHVTDLNTYVLGQDGKFIFHHEEITIPAFMPGGKEGDLLYFNEEMNKHQNTLHAYTNEWGLQFLGYTPSNEAKYTVIIGPFFEHTPHLFEISKRYNLSHNEREDLSVFCNYIHILNIEKTNSFASVLQQFNRLMDTETIPVSITADSNDVKDKPSPKKERLDKEVEIVKMRYEIEADMLHAVKQGQKAKALELSKSNDILFSFSDRFPNQPLRRVKNLAIVLNTLLRSVAVNSSVPAILIHRVSNKFANEIEYTNNLSKLQQLYSDMIIAYTDLILSNNLANYSKITRTAIEYLISFYDRQIDKDKIASLCFTHPSHLSRKFKQETNMTITGYQQMIRINQAKHLLINEAVSIEEIAWNVGYEDASYFTRIFKKETGYTPTEYREKNELE